MRIGRKYLLLAGPVIGSLMLISPLKAQQAQAYLDSTSILIGQQLNLTLVFTQPANSQYEWTSNHPPTNRHQRAL